MFVVTCGIRQTDAGQSSSKRVDPPCNSDPQQTGFKGNLRLLIKPFEQPHLPFKILSAALHQWPPERKRLDDMLGIGFQNKEYAQLCVLKYVYVSNFRAKLKHYT